jgi:hypothetical protein
MAVASTWASGGEAARRKSRLSMMSVGWCWLSFAVAEMVWRDLLREVFSESSESESRLVAGVWLFEGRSWTLRPSM